MGAGQCALAYRPNRGEKSLSKCSPRARRALLLAGGCCSSLIVLGLPSTAFAQTTDQTNPDAQQPEPVPAPVTAPGDVNAPQPKETGAIVVTGIRKSIADSLNIKRTERGVV